MPTTVYSNTDKPYAEWKPAYVILSSYEKGVYRPLWVKHEWYVYCKPVADKLIQRYWEEGRCGKRSFNEVRLQPWLCETIAAIINDEVGGPKCVRVEYPPYEQNHCRVFHLER
jgi:hypothetical protein